MANCTLPPSMHYYPPKSKPIDDLMMKRLKNIGDDQAAVEKESSILGYYKGHVHKEYDVAESRNCLKILKKFIAKHVNVKADPVLML